LRRLLHQSVAAEGAREVLHERREILGRRRIPGEPTEDRLHRAGACSEHVVVELLGEVERRARVVELCLEACYPRETTVDERLKRRARGCVG
jgi:hypothetical protein